MCISFPTKTSYPCISTQIARHGCHFCPCRSLTYCFSVSRLIHKTETTGGAIERTSHTNLSYSIIPCRAADTKLPAAVRHGNKTVFLFLSEFSNCSLSISFNLRPSRQSGLCSRFIALPILVLSTIISPSHIIFTPTQSYEIVHWLLFFCGEVLLTTTSYPIADSIFTKVSTLMLFPVRRLLTADCVL